MQAQAPPSAYRIHTSDDHRALAIARDQRGVRAQPASGGLTVEADDRTLDPYVLALGRAGVAVRSLELEVSSLESMFFALTDSSRADPVGAEVAADRGARPRS
jgi:ABC-2 type transport system ATP-binding protein